MSTEASSNNKRHSEPIQTIQRKGTLCDLDGLPTHQPKKHRSKLEEDTDSDSEDRKKTQLPPKKPVPRKKRSGNSYARFVAEKSKDPEIRKLPSRQRFAAISKLWAIHKSKA